MVRSPVPVRPSRPLTCYLLVRTKLTHLSRHAVDGSPKCGSCWKLQYCDQPPVYMIAVDNAAIIQLGKPAFDKFAGEEGAKRGSVNATAVEVDPSFCGLC